MEEFFRLVSGDGWIDPRYDPERVSQMLREEPRIKTGPLDQFKTLLPSCGLGKRFSEGHSGEMIERGHVRRLLIRLEESKTENRENG